MKIQERQNLAYLTSGAALSTTLLQHILTNVAPNILTNVVLNAFAVYLHAALLIYFVNNVVGNTFAISLYIVFMRMLLKGTITIF